jgi:hypothetical protein
MTTTSFETPQISFRSVMLPVEHGGWGLLFEPIVLALAVAPSSAGVLVAVAATAAFLLRHPLKLAAFDWLRRKRYPRTRGAEIAAAGYALLAAASLFAAVQSSGTQLLLPLLLAAPLFAIQLAFDVRNSSRNPVAEFVGTAAAGALAASVALAAGASTLLAFSLWAVMLLRSIPAVTYIRTRLRLERGMETSALPTVALHGAAVAVLAYAASAGLVPSLVIVPFIVLFGRAAIGLSPWRRKVTPKRIGFTEVAYGVMTVTLCAFAFHL